MTRPNVNAPTFVRKDLRAATREGSQAGTRVSEKELDQLVARARLGGFTQAEKQDLALGWATLFKDGFQGTAAANDRYGELAKKYDLPLILVK